MHEIVKRDLPIEREVWDRDQARRQFGDIGESYKVEIIDENITPHWRRQGLSVGQTVVAWLAFILSEADHRLSYVEPWVVRHLETRKDLFNG